MGNKMGNDAIDAIDANGGANSDLTYALHSSNGDLDVVGGTVADRARHQRWDPREKARITAESFEPGASVSAVARRNGVSLGLLHYWRRQVRDSGRVEELRFVPLQIEEPGTRVPVPAGAIELEIADIRIRLHGAVDASQLRSVLAAVRQ